MKLSNLRQAVHNFIGGIFKEKRSVGKQEGVLVGLREGGGGSGGGLGVHSSSGLPQFVLEPLPLHHVLLGLGDGAHQHLPGQVSHVHMVLVQPGRQLEVWVLCAGLGGVSGKDN